MIKNVLFILGVILLTSCASKKTHNVSSDYPLLTVVKIDYGRDGYGAILKNTEGEQYSTTISIPNLGDNYMDLKVGDKVIIEGTYSEKNPTYIITKRIKKFNNNID